MSKTVESPNIRISRHSKATLRELANHEGKPMQTVLDEAIEQYRRDRFFRELDEGYARLQADPQAWQEERDERRRWDTTLADGLDSE
jgi:predicted DNA-binding protein